jgi:vancomycin resistance protein YoaR
MKHPEIKKLFKSKVTGNIIIAAIAAVSIALIYFLISVYFCSHFFFHTEINGVNVSLKARGTAEHIIKDSVRDYVLQLTERNGQTEKIAGRDIDLQYDDKIGISGIDPMQNSFQWIVSLFREQDYTINGLYFCNRDLLKNKTDQLTCLNGTAVEPQNVTFQYSNGSYEVTKERSGNVILKDELEKAIKTSIEKGETNLNLEEKHCYKNPKYTLSSEKTQITRDLLNRYVSANITYGFGGKSERLDGNTIHKWLGVDDDLEVAIDKTAVRKYVNELSRRYDTVGTERDFKTSTGKTIAVKGGLYGWKIDRDAEAKALLENITRGETLKKEPVYAQKAFSRGENEMGNTYLEIDLTKQHVWFYLDGKLIADGPVVTGNPNRGWSTVTGIYMLNYKQKGATLSGPGYKTEVTYWMPFYGNTGMHDASWRYAFGGEIYKRNGTHGCINAPFYLAKTVYNSIEAGTPIICYEE